MPCRPGFQGNFGLYSDIGFSLTSPIPPIPRCWLRTSDSGLCQIAGRTEPFSDREAVLRVNRLPFAVDHPKAIGNIIADWYIAAFFQPVRNRTSIFSLPNPFPNSPSAIVVICSMVVASGLFSRRLRLPVRRLRGRGWHQRCPRKPGSSAAVLSGRSLIGQARRDRRRRGRCRPSAYQPQSPFQ